MAPVLAHFDPDVPITIETDASYHITIGILSQRDQGNLLRPVAFFSKKHSPPKCNYAIYDKELLTIIQAFEELRPALEGALHPIEVLSIHKNLEYFMTTKQLNRREVRWIEYLSGFNFTITFRPGKQNGKADALTRRSGDLSEKGDERLQHQSQVILKKENLDPKIRLFASALSNKHAELDETITKLFNEEYQTDPFPLEVLDALVKGIKQMKKISSGECNNEQAMLICRGRDYVPDYTPLKLELIRRYHDNPSAGHAGREKPFELIGQHFFWSKMRETIPQYLRNWETCKQAKASHHSPHGYLKPLPIAQQP